MRLAFIRSGRPPCCSPCRWLSSRRRTAMRQSGHCDAGPVDVVWRRAARHGCTTAAAWRWPARFFAGPIWCLPLPFWFAWAALFAPLSDTRIHWCGGCSGSRSYSAHASGLLWVLLVREIPESPLSFEWKTNFMLMAAFLSYPFNPSVVIIAAIGWLVLWKINFRYAMVHLLLLTPLVFYFGNLSSPKYIILCMSVLRDSGRRCCLSARSLVRSRVRRGRDSVLVGDWRVELRRIRTRPRPPCGTCRRPTARFQQADM